MMLVEIKERDSGHRREVLPIETYNEGALSGGWSTEFVANEDSTMIVHASYTDPDWEDKAKLIWVDFDTLRYIIDIDDVAHQAMGNEVESGQEFAWYWEYTRVNGKKEEE